MIEVAVEQIPIAIERRRLKDFVYPAIFLAILFALDLHTAYTQSLWFDELSTLFVVSTPTLLIWSAPAGMDQQAPHCRGMAPETIAVSPQPQNAPR